MRNLGIVLLLMFLVLPLLAQRKESQESGDPFQIGKGSQFSASKGEGEESARAGRRLMRDYSEALRIVQSRYADADALDSNTLTKSAIASMLSVLDPHSSFFDRAEYRELLSDQRSEYFGIGSSIVNYSYRGVFDTYITSTVPGSPANRKGLRFGDKIIAVNGRSVRNKSSYYVRNRVRGPMGTTVRLTIERLGLSSPFAVTLRRKRVPQPSIGDAYMIRKDVGYIDLTHGFNYTTQKEFEAALRGLRARGMKSLILDLRDNTGGILEQAVRVAEKFVPAGKTIVSQRGRFAIDKRRWISSNGAPLSVPLIILVNGETASASEIVAGALQDYDRALIVGDPTYGKGLVQSVIDLPGGAGLTLTTAKYYTPSGRSIQRNYDGSRYEYFTNKKRSTGPRTPLQTASGRVVYSGNGISPDLDVDGRTLSERQRKLLDPVFHFTRYLVAGRIKGFEQYRVYEQIESRAVLHATDVLPSKELFSAFTDFVHSDKRFKEFRTQTLENKEMIVERIRFNYASAKFGNVTARQILLDNDPQVTAALKNLPEARKLARSARSRYARR